MSELEIYKDDKYATIYYKKPFYIVKFKNSDQFHMEHEEGDLVDFWSRNTEVAIESAKRFTDKYEQKFKEEYL